MRRLLLCLLVLAFLLSGCGKDKTTQVIITPRPSPAPAAEASPELLPLVAGDEVAEAPDRAAVTAEPEPVLNTYVLNTNTKKFHRPGCASVSQMKEKNKRTVEAAREEIIAQGYDPCGNCHP